MAGWRWEIRHQTAIGLSNLRGKSPKKAPGVSLRFLVWIQKPQEFHNAEHEICGSGSKCKAMGTGLIGHVQYKPTILIYWLCPHQHYWNLWLRSAPLSTRWWLNPFMAVCKTQRSSPISCQAQYHVKCDIMWYHVYTIVYIYICIDNINLLHVHFIAVRYIKIPTICFYMA